MPLRSHYNSCFNNYRRNTIKKQALTKSNKKECINEDIRANKLRLIGDDGAQLGIVSRDDALSIAQDKGLDLLLVSDASDPPVCRLINYGQYRYRQSKKDKKARKASKGHVTKELKMSPKISDHDFNVRVNQGREFLKKGYKVKLSVPFRGREIVHPELGEAVMQRYLDELSGLGNLDSERIKAPRALIAIINPK